MDASAATLDFVTIKTASNHQTGNVNAMINAMVKESVKTGDVTTLIRLRLRLRSIGKDWLQENKSRRRLRSVKAPGLHVAQTASVPAIFVGLQVMAGVPKNARLLDPPLIQLIPMHCTIRGIMGSLCRRRGRGLRRCNLISCVFTPLEFCVCHATTC